MIKLMAALVVGLWLAGCGSDPEEEPMAICDQFLMMCSDDDTLRVCSPPDPCTTTRICDARTQCTSRCYVNAGCAPSTRCLESCNP